MPKYFTLAGLWAGAIFFQTIQDVINFHPNSWLVQLDPEFMKVTEKGGPWLTRMITDGWHLAKQLSLALFFMAVYYAGNRDPETKTFITWAAAAGALAYGVHNIFFHLVF